MFVDMKLIIDKRGAPEAPPTHYPINFISNKSSKNKHIYIYMYVYQDEGKRKVHQSKPYHQPWQPTVWLEAAIEGEESFLQAGKVDAPTSSARLFGGSMQS